MSEKKRKQRTDLSLSQKERTFFILISFLFFFFFFFVTVFPFFQMEIINNFELPSTSKEKWSKEAILEKYGIQISTLNKILANKESISKSATQYSGSRKAIRVGEHPALERGLYEWFVKVRAQNVPVTGIVLQQKALEFAQKCDIKDFQASPGWLGKFKSRFNIHNHKLVGESASTNPEHVVKGWEMVSNALKTYGADNCYNADETGLYFKMTPEYSLVASGEKTAGSKQSKERVTLLVCSNASGTKKIPLWMIGKFENPRGMPKEKPLVYKANKKAWMNSAFFEEFTKKLDGMVSCDTALILDNASVHGIASDLELKHLKIIFLPPNTTSMTQPMDAGIIQTIKLRYRKALVGKVWTLFFLAFFFF